MTTELKASDRLRIARELLQKADLESVTDCSNIARRLVDPETSLDQVLGMPELLQMPDLRAWLARQLGQAVGVLAPQEASI